MEDVTVRQNGTLWEVVGPRGDVLATLTSHALAWRWVDEHDDEAVKDQATHDRISRAISQW